MTSPIAEKIFELTDSAYIYLRDLLAQEPQKTHLRVFVAHAGTSNANIGMSYCPVGQEVSTDIIFEYEDFIVYLEKSSEAFLRDAHIDYKHTQTGGELVIKAPHLKQKPPSADSSLEERVRYVIKTDINPVLASHGGHVHLVEIDADNTVYLRFGGGCHGCGMAGTTFKNGIVKTLREKFPEVTAIEDVTDHKQGVNPYYKRKS